MIWTQPKRIRPVQNNWYSTKMIWTDKNHSGPIEVQGIRNEKLFFGQQSVKCEVHNLKYLTQCITMDVLHHALVFRFQFTLIILQNVKILY